MTRNTLATSAATIYAQAGPLTDLSMYRAHLVCLPASIADLCRVTQGVLTHVFWQGTKDTPVDEKCRRAMSARPAAAKLAAILALDDRPITIARPPERRLPATSRDYSLLLTALLRYQGIPARSRCGFATYLAPQRYEEHWLVECWNIDEGRWVLVDPHIDEAQRAALNISFDPLDVPRVRFLSSGAAWQRCRSGMLEPTLFGNLEDRGMHAIRCTLIRDLAALNRVEMQPWERWGLMIPPDEMLSDADIALLDTVAHTTVGAVATLSADAVEAIYASDPRLRPPTIGDD
ncbi:MAG: transglutaminase-like domain-containing protein [Roseiflexaceae bacterium]|nr:transglutaminase-like domain-containing protein [Roseiflexus sp.]MDW8212304.1 transglutaminase-like domain-containing protein [Roseiflexaceae bacterium]